MNTVATPRSLSAATTPGFSPSSEDLGPFGIYFGWCNVAAALVCIMVSVGATSYSFGLFIKPASAELGLSRANTNLGLIFFHLGTALASPLVGKVLQRFALGQVLLVAAALFMAGMIGISVSSSPLLIGACIFGPVAFGTVGVGAIPGLVLVSRWFSDRRGRAISIMALGTSFGGLAVFPLIALFMALLGWRNALVAVAGLVGTVVLIMSLLMRTNPHAQTAIQLAERSPTAESDQVSMTQRQILSHRDFWMISIPVALMLGVDGSMLATVTPYMLDRGMSLAATASVMSATTASAIAGKLVIAWIADRSDLRLLLAVTGIFGVVMCLTLVGNPSYLTILGVSLLTGLAVGGTYPLGSAIMAQRFGAASVGSTVGLKMPIVSVVAMSSLYFVGTINDLTGSYSIAFLVFAGVFAMAICILPFVQLRQLDRTKN